MLRLDNVSKTYQATHALHPITLALQPGKTTVLIGPSGCGKSTLLRLMIGLIQPDTGSVRFDDVPLTPETIRSLRHRIGYVIQEGGLFPHLTAAENVTLMARYLGRPHPEDRLHELATLTRLPEDRLSAFPTQLSGGQRQRVGLMRALMLNPDVLLLDEPLGALDPMIRARLQEDLRTIFQQLGKTVVLVTHDLGEAAYFGDTIVLLRAGRIVQEGSPQQLILHPADPFVTEFIRAQRSPLDAAFGNAS